MHPWRHAAALTALKRKKLIDAQVEKVSASKMTLEQQRMALEQVNISKVTFDAIDAGKRELERLNKEMGVERVEETMDELEEQIELQNETADALARPLNAFGVGEDEVRPPPAACCRAARQRALTDSPGATAPTLARHRTSCNASSRSLSRQRWMSTSLRSTRPPTPRQQSTPLLRPPAPSHNSPCRQCRARPPPRWLRQTRCALQSVPCASNGQPPPFAWTVAACPAQLPPGAAA